MRLSRATGGFTRGELHFIAGLTTDEIAPLVGRSERAIKRERHLARAWRFRELQPSPRE